MQLRIHIADHFDTLASGKVLAVGLFPDRVVLLNLPADAPEPSVDVPFAFDLDLLITLTGPQEEPVACDVRVLAPGAAPPVANLHAPSLQIAGGSSTNIASKLRPLLVPQAGLFTVEVTCGDQTLRDSFEVRLKRVASSREPLPPDSAPARAAAAKPKPRRRAPK
jgi:hypothetical protein